jgi:hypothetical protein
MQTLVNAICGFSNILRILIFKGTCKKKDTPLGLFFSETVLLNDVFF